MEKQRELASSNNKPSFKINRILMACQIRVQIPQLSVNVSKGPKKLKLLVGNGNWEISFSPSLKIFKLHLLRYSVSP